jgi:formylglycine-generating enzyme required for sulfatase activity
VEGATGPPYGISFTLDPEGSLPKEMVHVPGGSFQWADTPTVELPDYLLDKYEVTNRDFKTSASGKVELLCLRRKIRGGAFQAPGESFGLSRRRN